MDVFDLLLQPGARVLLALAVILFTGFVCTRLTDWLHLPNVTAYIGAGILLGPCALNLVPASIRMNMDFVTDLALALIAFDVGRFARLPAFKKHGRSVMIVAWLEALFTGALVALAMALVFRLPLAFSLLLGAIGCATAPASTMMTIRQYHGKGDFVDMLLQVVALDDAVSLLAFSVCAAVVQMLAQGGQVHWALIWPPLCYNVLAVALGLAMGWLLSRMCSSRLSSDHRLILAIVQLLAMTGLCAQVQISPLLACMAMGAAYMHFGHSKKLFKQLNRFSPPVLMLFFVLSGMNMNLPALATTGVMGVGYFLLRIAGKYGGAWLGARAARCDPAIRKYLGLALIPQAGVSIGLSMLGQRLLPAPWGEVLSTIILSSAVCYELIGPVLAKTALRLSGAIRTDAAPHAPSGGPQEKLP